MLKAVQKPRGGIEMSEVEKALEKLFLADIINNLRELKKVDELEVKVLYTASTIEYIKSWLRKEPNYFRVTLYPAKRGIELIVGDLYIKSYENTEHKSIKEIFNMIFEDEEVLAKLIATLVFYLSELLNTLKEAIRKADC